MEGVQSLCTVKMKDADLKCNFTAKMPAGVLRTLNSLATWWCAVQ